VACHYKNESSVYCAKPNSVIVNGTAFKSRELIAENVKQQNKNTL
jgi:hypothetical protein